MKRFVFFLLLSFVFSVDSFSQLERVNVGDYVYMTGSDNTKTIHNVSNKGLEGYHSCIDELSHARVRPSLDYAFEKTKKGTIKYWELEFTLHSYKDYAFSLQKGRKILLRLFDDSVITLVSTYVDLRNDDEYGTWLLVHAKLTESALNRISSIGVKKLRIETNPQVCDAVYEKDEIGVFVKKARTIINDMLKPTTPKPF